VFGVLAGLVLLSTRGCIVLRVWVSIAAAVIYGVVDELHQGCVKGRTMDPWDICSDGMGACLFSFLVWWLLTGDPRPKRWILPCLVFAAGSVHLAAS
jgi:VanZ family protein